MPKAAPAFSALGVLVADYVVDLVRAYVVPLSQVDLGRLRELMHEVDRRGPQGAGADRARPRRRRDARLYAQMCYPGQNFDMSVPVPEGDALDEPGLLDLAERFHDQHETERGFCFRNQQPLVRGVRFVAAGHHARSPTTSPSSARSPTPEQARKGTRPAYFGVEFVDTPVYDGAALGPGAAIAGPRADRGAVHGRRRPAGRHRRARRARQLRVDAGLTRRGGAWPAPHDRCRGARVPDV